MEEPAYAGPPPVIAMGGACVLFYDVGRVLWFAERRIRDAAGRGRAAVARVGRRSWRG